MKKILFISTALLAALTACDDYNDQFNLDSQISDVKKGVAIKLAAADYATIANNATNKEIALSKDPENGTYVAALEAIGKTDILPARRKLNGSCRLSSLKNIRRLMPDLVSRFRTTCTVNRLLIWPTSRI